MNFQTMMDNTKAFFEGVNLPVAVTAATAMELSGMNAMATTAAAKLGGSVLGAASGVLAPLAAMAVASFAAKQGLDYIAGKLDEGSRVRNLLNSRNAITGVAVAAGLFMFVGPLAAVTWGLAAVSAQRLLDNYRTANAALTAATVVAAIAAPFVGLAGLAGRLLATGLGFLANGFTSVTKGVIAAEYAAVGTAAAVAAAPTVLKNMPAMTTPAPEVPELEVPAAPVVLAAPAAPAPAADAPAAPVVSAARPESPAHA